MTSQSDPQPPTDGGDYPQTGQHGPEMDDTQVAATEELRDRLPEVGTDDQGADPSELDDAAD
jgi:hypothetical protein